VTPFTLILCGTWPEGLGGGGQESAIRSRLLQKHVSGWIGYPELIFVLSEYIPLAYPSCHLRLYAFNI
jgi:hypothetical protein